MVSVMEFDYKAWQHVFKLDPAKTISDEDLAAVCESGTDAIIVGGTDNITLDNVLDLLVRVRRYAIPVMLEASALDAVTPGFDSYGIPVVLNSTEAKWITGMHQKALKEYGDILVWEELIAEGYCVLNPDCKVAALTKAKTALDVEDVRAYARMAEQFFALPIFYMEYSGQYGDVAKVRAAKDVLTKTRLFYGGGIATLAQAEEMKAVADTIVVGNVIYEDLKAALSTVKVKNTL